MPTATDRAWEYDTLAADGLPSAGQLSALGAVGWCLVAMVPHGPGWLLYLMRPLPARPGDGRGTGPRRPPVPAQLPPAPSLTPEQDLRVARVRAILTTLQEGLR
jgi:hypothetical protein